jgi:hypothetical protein
VKESLCYSPTVACRPRLPLSDFFVIPAQERFRGDDDFGLRQNVLAFRFAGRRRRVAAAYTATVAFSTPQSGYPEPLTPACPSKYHRCRIDKEQYL